MSTLHWTGIYLHCAAGGSCWRQPLQATSSRERAGCPDLEQTEQQEQQILPRSHLEKEIKLASDKSGICQAWGYSIHTELVPPVAGKKKNTTESNPNLLELGLSELFPSTDQSGMGHWVPPEGLHIPPERWRGHSQLYSRARDSLGC